MGKTFENSMHEQLTGELLRIVRAVRILSLTSFSLAGEIFSAGDPRQHRPPYSDEHKPLVNHLGRQLYLYCYCRKFEGLVTHQQFFLAADDDFVGKLSEANVSRERLDHGWRVLRGLPTGHCIAQKNGFIRMPAAGEFIPHGEPGVTLQQEGQQAGHEGVREGGSISIRCPKESKTMHPGFYYIFGEALTDQQDDDKLLRFYWNIKASGAESLVRLLTQRLNRFQLSFRLKCLNNPLAYKRADAAVLYINVRFYRLAAELVADVHRQVEGHLEPYTPLFTKPLAAGLSVAEEPGNGESFGQQRCRILAEALWNAYELNLPAEQQQLEQVTKQFELNNLSLEFPYLNPGSTDQYHSPLCPPPM